MDSLIPIFKERLQDLGGEVIEVGSDPRKTFQEFITRNNLYSLASWDTPFLHGILDSIEGIQVLYPGKSGEELRRIVLNAQAGVTDSFFAVAETGTLALPVTEKKPSLVSLIPELHIAFLEREKILANFEELFQKLWDFGIVEYILVSGPSRTADIEQTLTIGVHGPKRVVVFLT